MLLFKLSLRNIFRNTKRTTLTVVLVSFGLSSLMFVDGLIVGMKDTMIRLATHSFLGEAQVHNKNFEKSPEVENVIENLPMAQNILANDRSVETFGLRTVTGGTISSAANISGVMIFGIEADKELKLSQIKQNISQGSYLSGSKDSEILVGKGLARLLDVKLGDRVVLTSSKANTGELAQQLFRISGIFEFGTRELDKSVVYINLKAGQSFLNTDKNVHEIALLFTDPLLALNKNLPLFTQLSKGNNEAKGWPDILPELSAMLEMSQYSIAIVAIVLFLLIALGIINSLFMSIFERRFEFGVMKSVGTRPTQIFFLVLCEAGFIALISIFVGLLFGGILNYWTSIFGVGFEGFETTGVTMTEPIKTVLTLEQFTLYPLWIMGLVFVSAAYPAFSAARIIPSVAMRRVL